MIPRPWNSLLVIHKEEFIDAGGFDERFEFYGPEDKEMVERLHRRGGKCGQYSRSLISAIYTPNEKKIAGYRLKIGKREMHKRMMKYFMENRENKLLVANPDGWGKA